jgi:glutathione S-transferase
MPSSPDAKRPKTAVPKAALFQGDKLWDPCWKEAAGEATLKSRMAVENPDLILFSSWFCPFAQRAWIAAEETGVNYKWVEINPYQVDQNESGGYTKKALSLDEKEQIFPDFIDSSPRGLVPSIQHDNKGLWESLPVAEYIDAIFGGRSLVPRDDPYTVAQIQIWCAHCTDRIQPSYYRALVAQDPTVEAQHVQQFYQECRALANAMSDKGPFFLGDDFSLVDLALAPFWQRFICVGGHYFGLTFPDEPAFDRLALWWEATSSRPSVANTICCEARLISTYSDYSKGHATSDLAKNSL